MMSKSARDVLIAHIDGPVPVVLPQSHSFWNLLREGLICDTTPGPRQPRPKQTRLTEKGRGRLCAELADMADALVRAETLVENMKALALLSLSYETGKVTEPKYLAKVD